MTPEAARSEARKQIAGTAMFWTGIATVGVGVALIGKNISERNRAQIGYRDAVLDGIPGTGGPCDPASFPQYTAACSAHRDAALREWDAAKGRTYVGWVVVGAGLSASIPGALLALTGPAVPEEPANAPPVRRPATSARPWVSLGGEGAAVGLEGRFR